MEVKLVRRADGLIEAADDAALVALQNIPVGVPFILAAPKQEKQRTLTQNRALHKFLSMLAASLNECGLYQMKILKHDAEIPWSPETAKALLRKPLQEAVTQKASTADANTADYSKIHQVMSAHLAKTQGFTCPPWPSNRG